MHTTTPLALAQELTHRARQAIPEDHDDAATIDDAHTIAHTITDDPDALRHDPHLWTDALQILDDLAALTPNPPAPHDVAAAIASARRGLARHRRDLPDWNRRSIATDLDTAQLAHHNGDQHYAARLAHNAETQLHQALTDALSSHTRRTNR